MDNMIIIAEVIAKLKIFTTILLCSLCIDENTVKIVV